MTAIRQVPSHIVEIEHIDVPMPDGCRLAARIWMPEGAEKKPVPAILEYIPYRKNDMTLSRDSRWLPLVAAEGYAMVRLDLRGAGDSDGVMVDEYTEQELQDGVDAIAWLAGQTWCDGNVGMIGISWGGFNGLQVAARQPPALKAVITVCSTDDRYADDVHYMGGTMVIDQISWASIMFGRNTLPPDPANVGDRWREDWLGRLKGSGLWLKNWLEHQTRDDFWKHGSVCEDYSIIRCPVYAVSGWADGYCRAVFRLMENLDVPRKGLVGPWAHTYPHIGRPGPAIDFVAETVRWWDHWLKGKDTGIMDEPQLRLFMQDPAPPQSVYESRAGRWVAEPSWPSPSITRQRYAPRSDGTLAPAAAEKDDDDLSISICSPLWVGLAGGKWCSYASPGDQPVDQRADDAGSLVFETLPLMEPLEIAGDANLHLVVSSDKPVAQVTARVVDVHPDGQATRVCYGPFNLTHRDGHVHPKPLVPGRRYSVRVPLKHVAQRFETGHRIRLSISSTYFPISWPTPEPATLTVHLNETELELPVRNASLQDEALAPFADPLLGPSLRQEMLREEEESWRVVRDLGTGATEVRIVDDRGQFRLVDNDLSVTSRGEERYGFADNDYATLYGETSWTFALSRGEWRIRTSTWTRMTATAETFHIEARLQAWEDDELRYETSWSEDIPRRLV